MRAATDHAGECDARTACVYYGREALGVSYEPLRRWTNRAEVDGAGRDGVPTGRLRGLRALKRRNRELEDTIEIVKATTSYFARESQPRHR